MAAAAPAEWADAAPVATGMAASEVSAGGCAAAAAELSVGGCAAAAAEDSTGTLGTGMGVKPAEGAGVGATGPGPTGLGATGVTAGTTVTNGVGQTW